MKMRKARCCISSSSFRHDAPFSAHCLHAGGCTTCCCALALILHACSSLLADADADADARMVLILSFRQDANVQRGRGTQRGKRKAESRKRKAESGKRKAESGNWFAGLPLSGPDAPISAVALCRVACIGFCMQGRHPHWSFQSLFERLLEHLEHLLGRLGRLQDILTSAWTPCIGTLYCLCIFR